MSPTRRSLAFHSRFASIPDDFPALQSMKDTGIKINFELTPNDESSAALQAFASKEETTVKIDQTLGGVKFGSRYEREKLKNLILAYRALPGLWTRLKHLVLEHSSKLKAKGRAGLVSYCFGTFLFYFVGILWQWKRVTFADTASAASIFELIGHKLVRILASLLVVANIIEIPKLLLATALVPFVDGSHRILVQRLKLPNANVAAALQIAAMIFVWLALLSVSICSDYTTLTQKVLSESALVV